MEIKTLKIVGTANESNWSQVHIFLPQDEKLGSHGQLIAALSFKAKETEIEIASFGTEIITRLQEIYYSNLSSSVFKKISQTLETLEAEFLAKIELEAVIGAIWESDKTYLYLARNGHGQAWLKRGEAMVKLFKDREAGIEAISGELKLNDRLIIGTKNFHLAVAEGEIMAALTGSMEIGGESLGAIIHGHEHSSQVAAVMVETEEKIAEAGEAEKVETTETTMITVKTEKIKQTWQWLKEKWRLKKPKIWLQSSSRSKRSTLSAVVILLVVFGLSLFLAGRKKQSTSNQKNYQSVLEEVQYKYDEAHGLIKLNPLRAKSLLLDSQTRIQEYKEKSNKDLNSELKDLLVKIEADLGQTQREYKIDSGIEWFDFGLTKDGFKGSDWAIDETKVWAWDESTKTIIEVDLATRASRVVVDTGKLDVGSMVAVSGNTGFVISREKIAVINKTAVTSVSAEGWQNISDAVGFGSNLYLLDSSKDGQIWKYLGVASGLSGKRAYLKGSGLDLSEAVSLTIDGSVWVLFSDGTIVKYTQGVKEPFGIVGLDQNFVSPTKIFTSPEAKDLYVLDSKQTRVVVLSKTGEYQAQYTWPGLAGAKDFVVNETAKKMFFLTGEKVFTLDLRD